MKLTFARILAVAPASSQLALTRHSPLMKLAIELQAYLEQYSPNGSCHSERDDHLSRHEASSRRNLAECTGCGAGQ